MPPPAFLDAASDDLMRLSVAVGELSKRAQPPNDDYLDWAIFPAPLLDAGKSLAMQGLPALADEAIRIANTLDNARDAVPSREAFLRGQLRAIGRQISNLRGAFLSFDEEAKAFFGVEPPKIPLAEFHAARDSLDSLLPDNGPIPERLQCWRVATTVPAERVENVIRIAIDEARRITSEHLNLHGDDGYELQMVQDLPYSAFCSSQSLTRSFVRLNSSRPHRVDDLVELAAHELYPGHHTHGLALRRAFLDERLFWERRLAPLLSPQAVLAEGIAEAGIALAFPENERQKFEEELFTRAGLSPDLAQLNVRIRRAAKHLAGAKTQLARKFLDGEISADQMVTACIEIGASDPKNAAAFVDFVRTLRSYICTYELGESIVNKLLNRGGNEDSKQRWAVFEAILTSTEAPEFFFTQSFDAP